jgi:hypothetical protein
MIASHLLDAPIAQTIDSAVSHMSQDRTPLPNQHRHQRGPHGRKIPHGTTLHFSLAHPDGEIHTLLRNRRSRLAAGGPCLAGHRPHGIETKVPVTQLIEESLHGVDHDAACNVAPGVSSHPIGHDEEPQVRSHREGVFVASSPTRFALAESSRHEIFL